MSAPDRAERPALLRPRVDRSIVLVGLMGAGKSTVGRRLAAALGLMFVDADEEIERSAGCAIADIFDRYGEAAFRDCERRVIARLVDGGVKVVATGGGAFVDPDTRTVILEKAVSVWLRADLDVLMRRVRKRDSRPLLRVEDPRAVMERLMAERTPYYEQADLVVDSIDRPHERTVDAIIAALAARADGEATS